MSNFVEILDKFKLPLAILLLGGVLIVGGLISSKNFNKPQVQKQDSFPKESIVSPKQITIDVSGAVNKPGVYKLAFDSRIEDAVSASGGLRSDANNEYISKYLNMAQKLVDGTKVYIPTQGESGIVTAGVGVSTVGSVAGASATQVNINSAGQADLEALPGIGAVTAAKIIASRPYQTIDDLQTQKIVSKTTFEKIKSLIVAY